MTRNDTTTDMAESHALSAIAWILSDDKRAERLVAVTGLTPEDLRQRLGEPALLAAALAFLEGYEPDLIACANALGTTPATLVASSRALGGEA